MRLLRATRLKDEKMEAQGEKVASSWSRSYFMVGSGSKTRTNLAVHRMETLFKSGQRWR